MPNTEFTSFRGWDVTANYVEITRNDYPFSSPPIPHVYKFLIFGCIAFLEWEDAWIVCIVRMLDEIFSIRRHSEDYVLRFLRLERIINNKSVSIILLRGYPVVKYAESCDVQIMFDVRQTRSVGIDCADRHSCRIQWRGSLSCRNCTQLTKWLCNRLLRVPCHLPAI